MGTLDLSCYDQLQTIFPSLVTIRTIILVNVDGTRAKRGYGRPHHHLFCVYKRDDNNVFAVVEAVSIKSVEKCRETIGVQYWMFAYIPKEYISELLIVDTKMLIPNDSVINNITFLKDEVEIAKRRKDEIKQELLHVQAKFKEAEKSVLDANGNVDEAYCKFILSIV